VKVLTRPLPPDLVLPPAQERRRNRLTQHANPDKRDLRDPGRRAGPLVMLIKLVFMCLNYSAGPVKKQGFLDKLAFFRIDLFDNPVGYLTGLAKCCAFCGF
jgi:hypothetical protein